MGKEKEQKRAKRTGRNKKEQSSHGGEIQQKAKGAGVRGNGHLRGQV